MREEASEFARTDCVEAARKNSGGGLFGLIRDFADARDGASAFLRRGCGGRGEKPRDFRDISASAASAAGRDSSAG